MHTCWSISYFCADCFGWKRKPPANWKNLEKKRKEKKERQTPSSAQPAPWPASSPPPRRSQLPSLGPGRGPISPLAQPARHPIFPSLRLRDVAQERGFPFPLSLCRPGPTGQSPLPSSSLNVTKQDSSPNWTEPIPIPTGFAAFEQLSSPYKTWGDRPRLSFSLYPRKKPRLVSFGSRRKQSKSRRRVARKALSGRRI